MIKSNKIYNLNGVDDFIYCNEINNDNENYNDTDDSNKQMLLTLTMKLISLYDII